MAKEDPYAYMVVLRRVYGYFCNITGKLLYIGSSSCQLNTLEYNHRNCFKKYPNEKQAGIFRYALQDKIKDGTFKTLIELECIRAQIEDIEGQLIRFFKPSHNWDLDPLTTSLTKGRYKIK
jgi:hypothetical protein